MAKPGPKPTPDSKTKIVSFRVSARLLADLDLLRGSFSRDKCMNLILQDFVDCDRKNNQEDNHV